MNPVMNGSAFKSLFADRDRAATLVRRLLFEHALVHWRLYAIAFVLMAVTAACTAFSAYILGDVINKAYVDRNFPGIVTLAVIIVLLFALKGAASYGQAVMLARIGARIVAENQRRMFDKLLNEGLGFFANRHSAEFVARLATGASSASYVINLLVSALGRDLLSLIGLATVMVVRDPVMSIVSLLVAPPAIIVLRKLVRRIHAIASSQFTGGAQILETLQETVQGIRIVKAFTLEEQMQRKFEASVGGVERESVKMARVANRSSPLMETLGGTIEDGMPPLALTQARVEFADVRFAYRPDEPVLKGISFVAESSKVTALVGQSGGGKSTVLNLVLRFYDAQSGKIIIDGQDIATVSRRSLRRQMAYVGQDVKLFSGSIRDNIAFGRPDATETEIVSAARAAHAHDFIMSFPKGYDSPVGEHGVQLSGGQRQRVAIACALIKNAPIILLDEATAALDSESERHVQEAVAELCKGRTTIVIAHRLSTIMHADRILVVEGGQIVEAGRHEELLRRGGRYASFFRLQLQQHDGKETVPAAAAS